MSDQITPEIFSHLVGLAALELDPEEAEYLRGQLNHQLQAIHELEAVPLPSGLQVTSHGVPFTPAISSEPREDRWIPYPDPDGILGQVPQTDGRYIVVPEIPHTELG